MGRGLAEAAGVHFGVPDHFRMQSDMGSMLVFSSLGSSQRVQGFWQGGDSSIMGVVTRGTIFSDAPGMSALGWGQHTGGHNSRTPGQVPYSSFSEGKEMK